MAQLKKLFQSINIAGIELKNRIVMLPVTTGYGEADNTIGDRFVSYFAERAKGGVGLILVPLAPVDMGTPLLPGLYHDRFLPGLRMLVDAVHAHGAKIGVQLLLMYHWATKEGAPPEVVAPSPVVNRVLGLMPRPLSIEEIHQLIEQCGEAAQRAQEAGFDAIELHLGVGYLLNRFLSPCTNKRTDEYGGTLENRMRFPLETIECVKRRAGDCILICRISAEEFMEGGHTLEDSKKVAPLLEAAGVHVLNVQVGWHECPKPLVQMSVPRGAFIYAAEEIKKVVSVPVVAAHRINDPILAEQILCEGKADLIGMGRALFADPELPNKARGGRFNEIRPCVACMQCLDEVLLVYKDWGRGTFVHCMVNPRVGREKEYAIEPAQKPKEIFVVGGGPAGLEAARVAALRGHRVTLYEKGDGLGGQLQVACLPPYKGEIDYLTKSLIAQVGKAGVEVKLNTEVTTETIAECKPEAVVLATGGMPIIPDIPGVQGGNVVTAIDVLTGRKKVGERVIILGGGMVGCETADFLAQRGKKVTIVEMLGRIGSDIKVTARWVVMARLREAGVGIETKAKAEEITEKGVRVSRDGASEFFEGDTVVLALGFRVNKELAKELEGKVGALYLVGDCVEPRGIKEAIEEGFCIGREI